MNERINEPMHIGTSQDGWVSCYYVNPTICQWKKRAWERGCSIYQIGFNNVFLMRSHDWYPNSFMKDVLVIYFQGLRTFMSLVGKILQTSQPFSFLKYSHLEAWMFLQTKGLHLPSTTNKLGQPNSNHLLKFLTIIQTGYLGVGYKLYSSVKAPDCFCIYICAFIIYNLFLFLLLSSSTALVYLNRKRFNLSQSQALRVREKANLLKFKINLIAVNSLALVPVSALSAETWSFFMWSCLFCLRVWWGSPRNDPESSAGEVLNFYSLRLNTNLKVNFIIKARRNDNRIPASFKSQHQNTHWQWTPGTEDFFPFNKGHLLYLLPFLRGKTKIDSAHTRFTLCFSWIIDFNVHNRSRTCHSWNKWLWFWSFSDFTDNK